MFLTALGFAVLVIAVAPIAYYLLVLFSVRKFFRDPAVQPRQNSSYLPPVSNLKPVKGLDPSAYENFASFCKQDYPEYEVLFCVDHGDPAVPVIEKLIRDFPERRIRILFGSGRQAINDKVARLSRLCEEAAYDTVVISDSDVCVDPNYLRTVVAPLADPAVGAVTCFYVHEQEKSLAERLQTAGMISDFYAGILVARQLDGVKFALGPTIATTRRHLAGFGGYEAIESRPGDDLLVGRLIAEQGFRVELLAYSVNAVADYHSIGDLIRKRMRWMVVMRHMRTWGHLGLAFTQGIFWSLLAVAVRPTPVVACAYLGAYAILRIAITCGIGSWGLRQKGMWKQLALVPVWDALAFCIWVASFTRSTIRWRGADYYIRDGILVPAATYRTGQPPAHEADFEPENSEPYPEV